MKRENSIIIGLSIFTLIALSGCLARGVQESSSNLRKSTKSHRVIYGKASYYSVKYHGKRTASGEIYNMYTKTASHRTLPFNTMVRVTDLLTKKSDTVRINDRGPISKDRVIDLSYASAKRLGIIRRGVANVKIEILGSNRELHSNLPISKEVCVGDNCKASIIKNSNQVGESAKPFNMANSSSSYIKKDKVYYANSNMRVNKFPKIETFSKKTAIQVGAFRRYAGAKVYAKRYGLLSSRYKTVIKNEFKDAKPIYRVRIEGFSNEDEARRFMIRYSLNGAFLVRR